MPENSKMSNESRVKWADHDGKIYSWWKAQWEWNKDMSKRMRFIEGKMFMLAGVGALLGSGVGVWLFSLMTSK